MGPQEEDPKDLRVIALQDFLDGEDVAQRLGHLLRVDVDKAVVNPVVDEGFPCSRLRLGDLVLVVGKDEVLPSAVDVEGLPQQGHAHGGTLDMPPGPPFAPGAVPGRFTRLARLPEGEVEGIPLPFIHGNPRPRLEFVDVLLREFPVLRKLGDGEIDVAVHLIGNPLCLQLLYEANDLGDVFRRTRLVGGTEDAQGIGILVEVGNVLLRELLSGDPPLIGPFDDLVVHVGEVTHIGHVEPLVAEITIESIENHEGSGVTDVASVVNRHAADVHPHLLVVDGGKGLFPIRE